MKRVSYIILILLALLSGFCRSPERVIDQPVKGRPTEFHREPAKYIPIAYLNFNNRGVDRRRDVSLASSMGGGLGMFIHQPMSWMWTGHKFLYYYVDIDFSPERYGGVYPYDKHWVVSTYPGVYIRTYMPAFFKVHYGGGVNLRLSNTIFDRWGMYGQVGLEFYGLTSSILFIGHPGQGNWEQEYRVGYLHAPISN